MAQKEKSKKRGKQRNTKMEDRKQKMGATEMSVEEIKRKM
jgi:hypothetical protein